MLADLTIADAVGVVGSLTICAAYFAVSWGRLSAADLTYQLMNLVGAALLLYSLWHRPNPGAILIEVIWAAIALLAIARIARRR